MKVVQEPALPPAPAGAGSAERVEEVLRRRQRGPVIRGGTITMSQGDLAIFVSRPMSGTMLFLAVLILIAPLFKKANALRIKALEEGS